MICNGLLLLLLLCCLWVYHFAVWYTRYEPPLTEWHINTTYENIQTKNDTMPINEEQKRPEFSVNFFLNCDLVSYLHEWRTFLLLVMLSYGNHLPPVFSFSKNANSRNIVMEYFWTIYSCKFYSIWRNFYGQRVGWFTTWLVIVSLNLLVCMGARISSRAFVTCIV